MERAAGLGHEFLEGDLHEVELAHADSAGGEHGVATLDAFLKAAGDRRLVVAADAEVDAGETVTLQCREQALPVGVADLARLERPVGVHELVSGRKDAHLRPRVDD